jgi:hypothetical protein
MGFSGRMANQNIHNQDPVADPVLPSDAVETDAAPNNNPPADPAADQPEDTTSDASDPAADEPPKGKRPLDPNRKDKLLKANRKGVGGPRTTSGKERSRLNNLQHGGYSKLPFHLFPWESQEEYDDHAAPFRDQYQPVNQTTADILELFIQASWRMGRCNYVEALAGGSDPSDIDRYFRRLTAAATLRTSAERSYHRHLKKLEELLAAFEKNVIETEQAQREEEAKPEKKYTADGEEIHEGWPRYTIHKLSCLPEDPCNLHLEFIRTVSNKYSVIETPLRDFEGGKYLDPSYKPRGMKGEWPDYLLPQPKKES